MYDTAVELMKSGRMDEADVDELERVINVLVAKWESIDNRLNASRFNRRVLRCFGIVLEISLDCPVFS